MGNQRLFNQMTDLREIMQIVDSRYDNDAQQLSERNQELQGEIESLQNALKITERQGAHMDTIAKFFGK